MKIWSSSEELPDHINILYRRFPITPYVDKPWQCFKCQGYGHYASNCHNNDRCVVCSANHNVKDCPVKGTVNRKCVNCGGNHTANYGGCVTMMHERKVQHIRAFQNVSYRDAVKSLNKETRTNTDTHNGKEVNQPRNQRIIAKEIPKKNFREISTQTNHQTEVNNNDVTEKEQNTVKPNENLAFCLLDLFMSMLKADPIAKKCTLISKAFQDHLGIIVTKEDLLSSIKGTNNNNRPNPSPIIQTKSQHARKNVSKH